MRLRSDEGMPAYARSTEALRMGTNLQPCSTSFSATQETSSPVSEHSISALSRTFCTTTVIIQFFQESQVNAMWQD